MSPRLRVVSGVVAVALALGGCTLAFPTIGVVRAGANADVSVDEQGCERGPGGVVTVPCTHPGRVEYATTIVANAAVGFLADLAVLALLAATAPHFSNDNLFGSF